MAPVSAGMRDACAIRSGLCEYSAGHEWFVCVLGMLPSGGDNVCTTTMVESMWSVGELGARAYRVGGESVLSLKLVIVIIGLGLRGWI